MFTGLVEEIGKIKTIKRKKDSLELTIITSVINDDLQLGDSVATNGVCLTVTSLNENEFCADVMPETFNITSLSKLRTGSYVNLERAMKLNSRFGGHIVSGHIDCTGRMLAIRKEGIASVITVSLEPSQRKFVIKRGSISLEGVSLTVCDVDNKSFKVSIIPHTKDETTLLAKRVGDLLNIEFDVFGKYVLNTLESKNRSLNIMTLLEENSFL